MVPTKGCLVQVRRLTKGELYVSSQFCDSFKVAFHRWDEAIAKFAKALESHEKLRGAIWTLSVQGFLCHCLERGRSAMPTL